MSSSFSSSSLSDTSSTSSTLWRTCRHRRFRARSTAAYEALLAAVGRPPLLPPPALPPASAAGTLSPTGLGPLADDEGVTGSSGCSLRQKIVLNFGNKKIGQFTLQFTIIFVQSNRSSGVSDWTSTNVNTLCQCYHDFLIHFNPSFHCAKNRSIIDL